MGDFVCDSCGIVSNTALGHYWGHERLTLTPETKGKALCWLCIPESKKHLFNPPPRKEIIELYLDRQRKVWYKNANLDSSSLQ